jgi:hypothetical protein
MTITTDKFDKTENIMRYIDGQITKCLSEGKDIFEVVEFLRSKKMKFEVALQNCKPGEVRYKFLYTHNKVCEKRILDFYYIEALVFNYEVYQEYSLKKMFNLIQFRDKISADKFSVVI